MRAVHTIFQHVRTHVWKIINYIYGGIIKVKHDGSTYLYKASLINKLFWRKKQVLWRRESI